MSEENARHVVRVDPVEPELGIDPRRVVGGEEPVALQPPGGHQDEDPERGVAEAEARGRRLGEHPDHGIQPFRVVAVHFAKLPRPSWIRRQLLVRGDRRHAEEPAELIVAGHTPFAVAQDVHGRQVDVPAVRRLEVLK